MIPHYENELAYLDTFVGLVKCKVLKVHYIKPAWNNYNPVKVIDVKITASKGAYKKGETIKDITWFYVVPRNHVKKYTIHDNFSWEVEIK